MRNFFLFGLLASITASICTDLHRKDDCDNNGKTQIFGTVYTCHK